MHCHLVDDLVNTNSGHRRHTQQTQKVLTINAQKLIVVQNPWELDDYYSKERIEVFTAKRKQFRYLCKLLLGHKRELDIRADRKGTEYS